MAVRTGDPEIVMLVLVGGLTLLDAPLSLPPPPPPQADRLAAARIKRVCLKNAMLFQNLLSDKITLITF